MHVVGLGGQFEKSPRSLRSAPIQAANEPSKILNALTYLLKEHLLPIPPRPATYVKYFTIPRTRVKQPNA